MKKTVAVVMGGYSAEYDVSINSGNIVFKHLDRQKFEVYRVKLTRDKWVALADEKEYPIDMNTFSFILGDQKISFDAVFNAVHGNPGEDGPLAGYFELLNIPQTASGQFESALTFNKAECNILLKNYGIATPTAVFLNGLIPYDTNAILAKTGLPCFVKPSRSGSSIGVSKVKSKDELESAIAKARQIDTKVLVEGMVKGLEVGCGVSNHTGKAKALAVTDIVPKNEFFDYESKYSGLSEEVTPARIDNALYQHIKETTEIVYEKLGLNGLVRVDYIIDEQNTPILIEVNTVPGLSSESILPKQAAYAGTSLSELFNQTLEKALNSKL